MKHPSSTRIAQVSDAQRVAAQALPHSIPTIEQNDLTEFLRHSNLPYAYREQLLALRMKAAS